MVKCCHLQHAGPLLASCPSAFPCSQWGQINRQAEQAGSRGHPPPPRERIIPPLCRPRYHHFSNKTAFHAQTPRGGRHRPNNTTAQRTTVSTSVPAAREPGTDPTLYKPYCTSSSLSLLSCCSWACHLFRVKTLTQKNLQLTAKTIRGWLQHKVRWGWGSVRWKQGLAWSRAPGSVPVVSFPQVRGGTVLVMKADQKLAQTALHHSPTLLLLFPWVLKSDPVTVLSARFVLAQSEHGVSL